MDDRCTKFFSSMGALFRYYIVWCPPAFFISGLIFAHGLVEYAVTSIMITYLTDNWEDPILWKAVIVVDAQDGFSSVLVIVIAFITDVFGRFKAISFTTIFFLLGLLLLWVANPAGNAGLYVVVAVVLAVGRAGKEPPLSAFLADQLRRNNNVIDNNHERVEARTKIWWGVPRFLGAVVAVFALGNQTWKKTFAASVIVMCSFLFFFWFGVRFYHREIPTESILTTVYRVFKNAIMRRRIVYSYTPNDYFRNEGGHQLPLMPDFFFSRWLDKAAIIGDTSFQSAEEQEAQGKLCTVTQVKVVKLLVRMIPWVIATGNTFFFEQTSNLNNPMGNHYSRFVNNALYFIQRLTNYGAIFLWDLVATWFGGNKLLTMKVRIGIGLAFSCFCCIFAWRVEAKRLDMVTKRRFVDQEAEVIDMNVYWLGPQFCLLGLAQGLLEDGLAQFFYSQVSKSMKDYGPPFSELFLGIGKFITIISVVASNSWIGWIGDTVNESRLDYYYGIISILGIGNLFFIFGFVSIYVYKDAPGEDAASFVEPEGEQLEGEEEEQITVDITLSDGEGWWDKLQWIVPCN